MEDSTSHLQPALSKLAFKVFGNQDYDTTPVQFKICNASSCVFYMFQGVGCCLLLYRLVKKSPRKQKRSFSLILATCLLIYSSVVLSFLFAVPSLAINATDPNQHQSLAQKFYLVLCRDLPFSLIFIAHQIILSQYYELALILSILVNMKDGWQTSGNELTSKRQCLAASNYIICALLVAHFLDKSFYTFYRSSAEADNNLTLFATGMRFLMFCLTLFSILNTRRVVNQEQFLGVYKKVWVLHYVILGMVFLFQGMYEISYFVWLANPDTVLTKGTRTFLAFMELVFNISNVFSVLLLAFMMDKMTDKTPRDSVYEPILHQKVPFFVHLASVKLLNDSLLAPQKDFEETERYTSAKARSLSHSAAASQATARFNLRIERELTRLRKGYASFSAEKQWNEKVINLALRLFKFQLPENQSQMHSQLPELIAQSRKSRSPQSQRAPLLNQSNMSRETYESSVMTQRCQSSNLPKKQRDQLIVAQSMPSGFRNSRKLLENQNEEDEDETE